MGNTFTLPIGQDKTSMEEMFCRWVERCSHIRMAAKREALAAITLRPTLENSQVVLESRHSDQIQ